MNSVAVAFISTMVVVGLWPALREIGLWMALNCLRATETTWEYGLRSAQSTLSRPNYWLRLWEWELWSLGRWWLLFATITALWLAASSFNRRPATHRSSHTFARLFAFAPWLIVLEITFLIGVWVESPNVVPEPSTGFVVGIFSWDLWRWDCWLDRGWLIRGALPTFLAGVAFFLSVLRWRWPAAVFTAIILIPIALMWSVACTVAYQNGLP